MNYLAHMVSVLSVSPSKQVRNPIKSLEQYRDQKALEAVRHIKAGVSTHRGLQQRLGTNKPMLTGVLAQLVAQNRITKTRKAGGVFYGVGK